MKELVEKSIAVNELVYKDVLRKQGSINRLFPTFNKRVTDVANKGGVRLAETRPGLWRFRVKSASIKNHWYDVYVHWKTLEASIKKHAADRRLWNKDKTEVDYRKLAVEVLFDTDVEITCSCLTGDTLIPLLDGRTLSLEQLLLEFGTDKEFWVYSSDEKGDFIPAKAQHLGITGYISSLVEVVLDNGESVRCTPDHLFRLRDGGYAPAEELTPGSSLLPLYREVKDPTTAYSCSYERVKLNSRRDKLGRPIWKFTHRVVAEAACREAFLQKQVESSEQYFTVHHKNFNSLDNTPTNLMWFGRKEHIQYHSKCTKNRVLAFKKACKDPVFHAKMCENNRRAGRICKEKAPHTTKIWNQAGVSFMKSESGSRRASAVNNERWNGPDGLENRAKQSQKLVGRLVTGVTKAKLREAWKNPERRKRQAERVSGSRNPLYGLTGDKNPARRPEVRAKISTSNKNRGPEYTKRLRTGVTNSWKNADDRRSKQSLRMKTFWAERREKQLHNHKVVEVRRVVLDKPIPVYDLSVTGTQNYALACGVFVHNCPADLYWGGQYIRTQKSAKYTEPENRAPNVRNPKQYGAMCKHLQLVFDLLPHYGQTMASYLKKHYKKLIKGTEKATVKQVGMVKKVAKTLKKREKAAQAKAKADLIRKGVDPDKKEVAKEEPKPKAEEPKKEPAPKAKPEPQKKPKDKKDDRAKKEDDEQQPEEDEQKKKRDTEDDEETDKDANESIGREVRDLCRLFS